MASIKHGLLQTGLALCTVYWRSRDWFPGQLAVGGSMEHCYTGGLSISHLYIYFLTHDSAI